jgi:hypothetical protein
MHGMGLQKVVTWRPGRRPRPAPPAPEKKTPQRKPGRFLFWVDGNSLIGRQKLSVIVVAVPK